MPDNKDALDEKLSIAAAITGSIWGPTWNVDRSSLDADFFLCKGILENLFDKLDIRNVQYKASEIDRFHPTRAAVIEAQGVQLGVMGEISADVARRFDLSERTYAFELDFNMVMSMSGGTGSYVPLSRYPAVTRDLAVVIPEEVPYHRIEELLKSGADELLESLTLFDLYKGPQLQAGQKSLAFKVSFRSRERTLRDEDVDSRLQMMKEKLASALGARFRDT